MTTLALNLNISNENLIGLAALLIIVALVVWIIGRWRA